MNLFKEAVAFARAVFADEEEKTFYKRKLGKVKRLFQALMQHYLREAKNKVEDKDNMKIKKRRQLLATGRASYYRHRLHYNNPRCLSSGQACGKAPAKGQAAPSRGDEHYCTTSASAL